MTAPRICVVEGCDRPIHGRGHCQICYMRWYNNPDREPLICPAELDYWVDAEPVQTRVRELLAAGLTQSEVARAAETSAATVSRLLNGVAFGKPRRRLRPDTAAALLAIPMPDGASR